MTIELAPGLDFRLPQYRREVFLRFYQFHLRYRSHPGCVYYLLPFLRERFGWDVEEYLWFCFLNGNTQHPLTSLLIWQAAPGPDYAEVAVGFWRDNYDRLAFDTDRRHHKKNFPLAVDGYMGMVREAGSQALLWRAAAAGGWPRMWEAATAIPSFGRLSAFSFLEYVRIAGIDFDCDDLLLRDRDGSRSHRNGLCIVTGRDDYDWHHSNPAFDGSYPLPILEQLEHAGADLLAESRRRAAGSAYERDVSYFTLESALCTYKSWHRPNRRYPNVYNDMLYDRIRQTEARWGQSAAAPFWEARSVCLPSHLRLESVPTDPGCVPVKQNHYRLTGQVIGMSHEWPCFRNDFDDAVLAGAYGVRSR